MHSSMLLRQLDQSYFVPCLSLGINVLDVIVMFVWCAGTSLNTDPRESRGIVEHGHSGPFRSQRRTWTFCVAGQHTHTRQTSNFISQNAAEMGKKASEHTNGPKYIYSYTGCNLFELLYISIDSSCSSSKSRANNSFPLPGILINLDSAFPL